MRGRVLGDEVGEVVGSPLTQSLVGHKEEDGFYSKYSRNLLGFKQSSGG